MALDEAIKHCLEVAEELEKKANTYEIKNTYLPDSQKPVDCLSCAADHKQLAEWLTELKQWRRVYGICPSYEMCIPECREGYNAQIAEYKRLLKAAVEDFDTMHNHIWDCTDCKSCPLNRGELGICGQMWRYADEAEKLLKEADNG